jgi:hypothetical protein
VSFAYSHSRSASRCVTRSLRPRGPTHASLPTFRLIFGATNQRPVTPPPSPAELIGMGALACVREGLNPRDARGVDDLPPNVSEPLRHALVGRLDTRELKRAFSHTTIALRTETRHVDALLADRLAPTLDLLND